MEPGLGRGRNHGSRFAREGLRVQSHKTGFERSAGDDWILAWHVSQAVEYCQDEQAQSRQPANWKVVHTIQDKQRH